MEVSADLHSVISEQMYQQSFWWCYQKVDSDELVNVSSALSKELGRPVTCLDDLMGCYSTSLLKMKVEEAIKHGAFNDEHASHNRFLAAFSTIHGKRIYQNQIKLIKQETHVIALVSCIDVSEVIKEHEVEFGATDLPVTQVYERQEFLEKQNNLIKDAFAKQSRFLAMLSHELRSPLLSIGKLVKTVRSELNKLGQTLNQNQIETQKFDTLDYLAHISSVDEKLKNVNISAAQSNSLINDILTYTQTEYDGLKLRINEVELEEILEAVKSSTESITQDKNLTLSIQCSAQSKLVYADAIRLTQILNNLIINAVKFTQIGGVKLSVVEKEPGVYVFKVSDTSDGLSAESLDKVFQPFAKLNYATSNSSSTQSTASTLTTSSSHTNITNQYIGSGLGLYVVKQLVELMQGAIKVSSEPNQGVEYEVCLELVCKQESEAVQNQTIDEQNEYNQPAQKGQKVTGQGFGEEVTEDDDICTPASRILVADDSEINRMVISGYLADLDCDVVEAEDGQQAWNAIINQEFDYVILDIQMPKMDGVEVAYRVRELYQSGKQQQIKGVFAVTAGIDSTGFEKQGNLMQAGVFDEWVIKPVTKAQIVKLLKKDYRAKSRIEPTKPLQSKAVEKVAVNSSELDDSKTTQLDQSADVNSDSNSVPDHFKNLLGPLIEELNSNLKQLEELIAENNAEAIAKLAHYMKGNAMVFQLNDLVELCRALELLQGDIVENDSDLALKKAKNSEILQKIHLTVKSLEKY